MDIPGATAVKYKVASGDQGKALRVVVTATKGGLPPGHAMSAAVTVPFSSTTDLKLSRTLGFSWQTTTAKVTVATGASTAPTGSVTITVNGHSVASIPLTTADNGMVSYTMPKRGSGVYLVQATFVPDSATTLGSTSTTRFLIILF